MPNQRTRTGPVAAAGGRTAGLHVGAATHDTDVDLNDVLDLLATLTDAGFSAHDLCEAAARQAQEVAAALRDLAEDLAAHHNVIGRRTSVAMERLSEVMEEIAAASGNARAATLAAAEEAEALHTDMEETYRPVQRAAADADLATPSARVHNQSI
ncbi:hypothetical protein FOE67_25380 [Streptomyces calidiresistens]|uniref:Uncharacterized protein n=1 Tax=Streptomyces calidiresistens TaxID=1485586 RepID=A0A7W3XYZ9_9ACTN|nr:hypothetical protein [Streptomyces calidiresistens]